MPSWKDRFSFWDTMFLYYIPDYKISYRSYYGEPPKLRLYKNALFNQELIDQCKEQAKKWYRNDILDWSTKIFNNQYLVEIHLTPKILPIMLEPVLNEYDKLIEKYLYDSKTVSFWIPRDGSLRTEVCFNIKLPGIEDNTIKNKSKNNKQSKQQYQKKLKPKHMKQQNRFRR